MMFSWWRLVSNMNGGGQRVEECRNGVAVRVYELVLIKDPIERVLRRQFQSVRHTRKPLSNHPPPGQDNPPGFVARSCHRLTTRAKTQQGSAIRGHTVYHGRSRDRP